PAASSSRRYRRDPASRYRAVCATTWQVPFARHEETRAEPRPRRRTRRRYSRREETPGATRAGENFGNSAIRIDDVAEAREIRLGVEQHPLALHQPELLGHFVGDDVPDFMARNARRRQLAADLGHAWRIVGGQLLLDDHVHRHVQPGIHRLAVFADDFFGQRAVFVVLSIFGVVVQYDVPRRIVAQRLFGGRLRLSAPVFLGHDGNSRGEISEARRPVHYSANGVARTSISLRRTSAGPSQTR